MNRSLPVVVVFDAVGTVIRPLEPVSTTYLRVGREFGSDQSIGQISSSFRSLRQQLFGPATDPASSESIERRRWSELVRGVFPDVRQPDALFTRLWDYYADPRSWQVFEDVSTTFDRLGAHGIELAIGSNFDRRLTSICAALPELAPVRNVFCSSQLGYSKPDSRFFEAIVRALACSPGQLWMIGDDTENDVRGPARAGWKASHLNRDAEDLPGHLARHGLARTN